MSDLQLDLSTPLKVKLNDQFGLPIFDYMDLRVTSYHFCQNFISYQHDH